MAQETKQVADRLLIKVCHGCGEPMSGSGHHAHGGGLSPHREEEVVSLRAHEKEVEDAAWRALDIYLRSVEEAAGNVPDHIESGGGEWSLPIENRASAISYYAGEFGIGFTDVRCTRHYMRVDFSAIRDRAAEFAARPEDYGESPIAYTWDDEGWSWEDCDAKDPGAVAFWRCEEKPTKAEVPDA